MQSSTAYFWVTHLAIKRTSFTRDQWSSDLLHTTTWTSVDLDQGHCYLLTLSALQPKLHSTVHVLTVIRPVSYLQWPLLEDASQLLKVYHCLSASMLLICCNCNFIIYITIFYHFNEKYYQSQCSQNHLPPGRIYFLQRFHWGPDDTHLQIVWLYILPSNPFKGWQMCWDTWQ